MSHTTAKRLIFNWSDREIVDDLKQQKMEKVVMQELADAPVSIKKTGLFADIDKRFGESIDDMAMTGGTEGGMPPPEGGMPPEGGAPLGGGDAGGMPPLGGGDAGGAPLGGGGAAPLGGGGGAPMMEGMTDEEYDKHLEKLVYGTSQEPEQKKNNKQKEIIQENNNINDKLNKGAADMVSEIDKLLENNESINSLNKNEESEYVDIEEIENLELDE